MKRKVNSVLLIFFASFSFSQIDAKFLDHLTSNNLENEHSTYLNSINQPSDSLFYYKAKFNLKYPNDSLLLNYYIKSKPICENDSILMSTVSVRFLNSKDPTLRHLWFTELASTANKNITYLNSIFKASEKPNLYTAEIFPEELHKSFFKYKRSYNKKPFLAATFSALVPGTGKLYAGKTKTFFLTFILNSAYALQTIESSRKLGIKHPLTIINAGAFAVFYLSNIYGSYHAVLELRKERKKQFIKNATNFYN